MNQRHAVALAVALVTACSPKPQRVAELQKAATLVCWAAGQRNGPDEIAQNLDSKHMQSTAQREHTVDSLRVLLPAECAIANKRLEHYLDRGW